MAKAENNLEYPRVRRYRVSSGRKQAAARSGFGRRESEPAVKWACVSLEPDLGEREEAGGYRDRPHPEPPRRGIPRREASRRRKPEYDRYREPDYEEDHPEAYDDYDYRAPLPEREGLLIRAARAVVAAWDRVWLLKSRPGLVRPLLLAAVAFAAGMTLENQVSFLSWAAELLAAAALALRDWVNPGVQTALLFTGLISVTGVWLLKRVVAGPRTAPRTPRRVPIDRDAFERHL